MSIIKQITEWQEQTIESYVLYDICGGFKICPQVLPYLSQKEMVINTTGLYN